MKYLLLTLCLICSFSFFASGQDKNCDDKGECKITKDEYDTAKDALVRVPVLEDEIRKKDVKIRELNAKVKELENSQQTPCSLAIKEANITLENLQAPDTKKLSKRDRKYQEKRFKEKYKLTTKLMKNILYQQCGVKDKDSLVKTIIKEAPKVILNLALLFKLYT